MLYIGCTKNLEQRLRDHAAGWACTTTKNDPALVLLRVEPQASFSMARRREAQLKRWSRPKKEALVRGDLSRLHELSLSHD
jgi:putative endonuclease